MRNDISSSGTWKKSLLGTMKSANWPAEMRPRLPSSLLNQATFSVHMRKAVSRSSRLRCGYSCVPPSVLPVTIHDRDTQGLYDATRVASVPAETLTPFSSMRLTGGVASAARAP
ncbi:hypothetical protein D3C72_1901510 [compost metagenome]